MGHDHHWHGAPAEGFEPFADLLSIVARGIHDIFGADIAFLGVDDPFAIFAGDTGCGREAVDLCAEIAGALGEGLGQLRGVDIAVHRIEERAGQVMGFDERVAGFDLVDAQNFKVHTLIEPHAAGPFELLQSFDGVGEADGARDVVIHRIVDSFGQAAVKLCRIPLHIHDCPRRRECRDVAGGMPCRACGKFVFFEKDRVRPTGPGQMVEAGRADGTASDDDDTCLVWESHSAFLCFGRAVGSPAAPGAAGPDGLQPTRQPRPLAPAKYWEGWFM